MVTAMMPFVSLLACTGALAQTLAPASAPFGTDAPAAAGDCTVSFGIGGAPWSSDNTTFYNTVEVYLRARGTPLQLPYSIQIVNPTYGGLLENAWPNFWNWNVTSTDNGAIAGEGLYALTAGEHDMINFGMNVEGSRDAEDYRPLAVLVNAVGCQAS